MRSEKRHANHHHVFNLRPGASELYKQHPNEIVADLQPSAIGCVSPVGYWGTGKIYRCEALWKLLTDATNYNPVPLSLDGVG